MQALSLCVYIMPKTADILFGCTSITTIHSASGFDPVMQLLILTDCVASTHLFLILKTG